jgi:enoyl-CoA hydratase/carnithine racemase
MSGTKATRLERGSTDGGAEVATLTLANPPLNLFDQAMLDALVADLAELSARPPRALLLRAEGKLVSGGVDVHVFDGLSIEQGAKLWRTLFAQIIHPLEALPCPVVFVAHGLTLTAAFEIALACDLILAAPQAKFGLVETVVGLTPSRGGPQRLAERAGSGRQCTSTSIPPQGNSPIAWRRGRPGRMPRPSRSSKRGVPVVWHMPIR